MEERYIWLKGKHIPVTQEVYEEYYRPEWRENKRSIVRAKCEVSYESIALNAFAGHIGIAEKSAEEVAMSKMLIDDLRNALEQLTDDERKIICELFFMQKTERQLAQILGVSQQAINKRCKHILNKIKKIIN